MVSFLTQTFLSNEQGVLYNPFVPNYMQSSWLQHEATTVWVELHTTNTMTMEKYTLFSVAQVLARSTDIQYIHSKQCQMMMGCRQTLGNIWSMPWMGFLNRGNETKLLPVLCLRVRQLQSLTMIPPASQRLATWNQNANHVDKIRTSEAALMS